MVMIANMQYGWTLFVEPMNAKFGWDKSAIQVAFTIFILTETWLVPVEGYLVDKFGPKLIMFVGGILCGLGWFINSISESLMMLYLGAAIGGAGAGAVYGTSVGNALKWFPDRRGLAAGLTAAGFGIGSALTIIPISNMIKASGYQDTFLYFGIFQGVVIMAVALLIRSPSKEVLPPTEEVVVQIKRDFHPKEMLRTPVFWLMYVMFVMVAAGGLMATAQLAIIAKDFLVADVPVTLLGLTLPALTFALSLDRLLNGFCRPFFGWVSDKIGRENTMFIAFALEGLGILVLYNYGTNPVLFVILSGLVFFAWGEIYSLFPAINADTFGRKFSTANFGFIYTAKGTASLLIPLGSLLAAAGGWKYVFLIAAVLNITAAILALFVLKPMRKKFIDKINSDVELADKEYPK